MMNLLNTQDNNASLTVILDVPLKLSPFQLSWIQDANNRIVEFLKKTRPTKINQGHQWGFISLTGTTSQHASCCWKGQPRYVWFPRKECYSKIILKLVKVSMLMSSMDTEGCWYNRISLGSKYGIHLSRKCLDSRNRQWKIYSRKPYRSSQTTLENLLK